MNKEKQVISIVGAGGKTTLMFSLAKQFRENYKVMVTTTTKIFLPNSCDFDFIAFGDKEIEKSNRCNTNGIYLYGNSLNSENKILGLDKEILESSIDYFDCVIIESDGANRKLAKGWSEKEPVIINSTTATYGVLNVKAIDLEINLENVHRPEEFIKIASAKIGDKINIHHLKNMVFHGNGLFKSSNGKRILYIIGQNEPLLNTIKLANQGYIDEIRCIK